MIMNHEIIIFTKNSDKTPNLNHISQKIDIQNVDVTNSKELEKNFKKSGSQSGCYYSTR